MDTETPEPMPKVVTTQTENTIVREVTLPSGQQTVTTVVLNPEEL
jgi:hypothetical protein